MVFVGSAGNSSYDTTANWNVGPTMSGKVITVGAIEDSNPSQAQAPSDLSRALYFLDSPFGNLPISTISIHGSNYGPIDLWAPGDDMFAWGPSVSGVPPEISVPPPDV